MPKRVQKMFDGIAGRYDFLNHFLSLCRDFWWRRKACRLSGSQVAPVVLDICGGTGDFLQSYVKVRGRPRVCLVGDFSLGMLRVAQEKGKCPHPVQLDATQLPIQDACADLVLNGFGMRNLRIVLPANSQSNDEPEIENFVSGLEAGLRETLRVLKPGGRFVTLEFFRPSNPWTKLLYGRLPNLLIPVLGGLVSGKHSAYAYLLESVRGFVNVAEYVKLASRVGFQAKRISPCDGGIAHVVVLEKPRTPTKVAP